MEPTKHALLSPSSAHRWLHCTAAPLLEKDVEDKGSIYAAEGTLAHAYCALKLKTFLGQPTEGEQREIAELQEQYHTGEMDEYTDTYKTIVIEKFNAARAKTKDALLLVEVRLDFSKYIPEAFGTADAVIIADGVMEVIDFKYGKGVMVSATENPQMKIYALGAIEEFSLEYNITDVRMTIVQPRIDNLSSFEMSAADLLTWAEMDLKPKAVEAYSGKGTQHPGDWCQFCKIKGRCKALADVCRNTYHDNADPKLVSKEEMEEVLLPLTSIFKIWLSNFEEYALQQALAGVQYNGFKIVEGRSVHKITDQAAVMELLHKQGYADEVFMKPAELRGLTDLEKVIGKKQFSTLCADYISKPTGKPTLVPESDKRPAFNSAVADFQTIE